MKRKAIVIDGAEVTIRDLDDMEHRLHVLPSDTIGEVKARVNRQAHPEIRVDELCLLYRDKKLEDWARVKDYNIVDGDKMEMSSLDCYDLKIRYNKGTRAAIEAMGAHSTAMDALCGSHNLTGVE